MSDVRERYLACFNATDPEARARLITDAWSPDLTYVDPLAEINGAEDLASTIGAMQERFPGWVLAPVGEVDAHHNVARFRWGFGPVDEEPVVVGFDIVTTDSAGKIASAVGFLDKVPPEASV
jgi:SnoaL-like protein